MMMALVKATAGGGSIGGGAFARCVGHGSFWTEGRRENFSTSNEYLRVLEARQKAYVYTEKKKMGNGNPHGKLPGRRAKGKKHRGSSSIEIVTSKRVNYGLSSLPQ